MLTARHAAARVSHTSSLHAQFCPGPQGHACDRAGQGWPRHPAQEHIEGDGPTVFAHACKLGLEGIVSKRKDSAYRSGRSPDWLKMKNSDAPAVKRDEEEDWS
jgi:hypothetical protein